MSEEQKNELVRVVMSQTTYTFDEAKICLEDSNYNVIKVVREFMARGKDKGGDIDKKEPPRSKHQVVYGEIRKLMDSASNLYRKKQEMAKLYQQQADKVKAMKEATALQQEQQDSSKSLDDVD
jgi:hypothetical protein